MPAQAALLQMPAGRDAEALTSRAYRGQVQPHRSFPNPVPAKGCVSGPCPSLARFVTSLAEGREN